LGVVRRYGNLVHAEGTIRRRIIACACVILFAACTDTAGPNQTILPAELVVSNPVAPGALRGTPAVGSVRFLERGHGDGALTSRDSVL